jgi:serine/threonine-protein kinase HipA
MNRSAVEVLNVSLAFDQNRILVGKLAIQNRIIWFEYDAAFVKHPLSISPFKLPVQPGLHRCEDPTFEGLFGVFNDSLPDGFGHLLLDRHLRQIGLTPETLTPLDRLAYVGTHGMGALCYEPDIVSTMLSTDVIELDTLAAEAQAILEQESSDYIDALLMLNGSSNGARPKVMVCVSPNKKIMTPDLGVSVDREHWLIKFPSSVDPKDIAAIEFAYSLMAREAGIEIPDTYLFSGKKQQRYFGIRRFDRLHHQRLHVHTLSGLLNSDHRVPALDYETLLKVTYTLTKNIQSVEKAFRMAVFNVLAHNRDDHGKNFAFLMNAKGEWTLAPAYDLTFSYGPGGEQSTTVMGEGKAPSVEHLLKLAASCSLKNAESIIHQVRAAVARWPLFADQGKVGPASTRRIQHVINR